MTLFLYMVIIGIVASAVARLISPAEEWLDLVMALMVGIAGSFLGGMLATVFGISINNGWLELVMTLGLSVVLALALVIGYEFVRARYADDYDYDEDYDEDEYYDEEYDEDR